jgi:peptidoglycan/LPS O-acetylase OafA/YrhL
MANTATLPNQRTRFHIASLDGIRGLAALLVFFGHAGVPFVPGGFGVTVFFFLSGYLITTLLRREFDLTGSLSFRNFYLRRIYRIFPPLYIVMLILLLLGLTGVVAVDFYPPGVVAQFAQLTNYALIMLDGEHSRGLLPFSGIMWSLSVEEHFYLLFPPVLALLLTRKHTYVQIAHYVAGLCVIVLLWRCFLIFGGHADTEYTYHASDTRIDSIAYGCMLALWLNPAFGEGPAPEKSTRLWISLLLAAAGMLLVSFFYRSEAFRETVRYSMQGLALLPIFYCAMRYPHWPMFSWLNSPAMRGMGAISYTFYLSHIACLRLTASWLEMAPLPTAVVAFVAATAFSSLLYVTIERPLANARRKLHDTGASSNPPKSATEPAAS